MGRDEVHMLLRFAVTNHRSLRDRQELSMVASSLDDPQDGLIACRHVPGGKLLPSVVVYGANASGKSNLIDAMVFLQVMMYGYHVLMPSYKGIPRSPFAFLPTGLVTNTKIEIDFVIDDIRYYYGFETSDNEVTGEWLYAFPGSRRQMLFERARKKFIFGRGLKGRNAIIADFTGDSSLFLSIAAQHNHRHLTAITQFLKAIAVHGLDDEDMTGDFLDPETLADFRIIQFLGRSGTGITGYRVKPQRSGHNSIESGDLSRGNPAAAREKFVAQLAHSTGSGTVGYLDTDDESQGTKRLIIMLKAVFEALDLGSVLALDEIDSSLHTHACEQLLALFANPATNPKGAQLIATTHDTNLLNSPSLRRDQVWLTEKDNEGATHLYPLTDFRTRRGDNLERGYLQGRFGAVPFAGHLRHPVEAN